MDTLVDIIEINDIRGEKEFKGITFSGFKKTDVLKEFLKSVNDSKLESACYWCAELVCSGHYGDLWNIILFYFAKFIHIGNPKLIHFIETKCEKFKSIVNNGYSGQELRLRNNATMRSIFGEICVILVYSRKKHPLQETKISTSTNFFKYKAPNLTYFDNYCLEEDLKDLIVPINEFVYQIKCEKNSVEACYWVEWLLEFERKCKKENITILGRRELKEIDSKFQKDMAFCIWDILLSESYEITPKIIHTLILSSYKLFSLRYSNGTLKKRKLLIYFCIELLTNPYQNLSILDDKSKMVNLNENLNIVYKQVKKNEHSPNTDYLFNNEKANNLEKTIAKLDAMKNFENTFIPRV